MKYDGGPAFACASLGGHQPGMSLRDYFAANALRGLKEIIGHDKLLSLSDASLATRCYEIADAMLACRCSGDARDEGKS